MQRLGHGLHRAAALMLVAAPAIAVVVTVPVAPVAIPVVVTIYAWPG